jgi:hypothetical protein
MDCNKGKVPFCFSVSEQKAHVQTGAEPCHEFIGSACKGEIWQ